MGSTFLVPQHLSRFPRDEAHSVVVALWVLRILGLVFVGFFVDFFF